MEGTSTIDIPALRVRIKMHVNPHAKLTRAYMEAALCELEVAREELAMLRELERIATEEERYAGLNWMATYQKLKRWRDAPQA